MDISVIIPAYNEERFVAATIRSIKKWMPVNFTFEILVVDHGSFDKTARIAGDEGALIVDGSTVKTIAALRNLGASRAEGNIFLFIDADVTFSDQWSENIGAIAESLLDNQDRICGSHPTMPEDANMLVKSWFNPKSTETSPGYIGACHLIMTRSLFFKIGGFPETMETAEEFTLCKKAREGGIIVCADPKLLVVHQGAPKTLLDFIKSEIWHGRGDWTSAASVFSSKVAILTLLFLTLHLVLLICLLLQMVLSAAALVLGILAFCLLSSSIKFGRHGLFYLGFNTATFYFYFFARSLSLVSVIISKDVRRRSRSA